MARLPSCQKGAAHSRTAARAYTPISTSTRAQTSSRRALGILWRLPDVWQTRLIKVPLGAGDRFFGMYISQDYVSTSLSRVILVLGVLEYRV